MLAIAATNGLFISDSSVLKRSPALLAPSSISNPISAAWASDNSGIFIGFKRAIHKYDPIGDHIARIFTAEDDLAAFILIKGNNTLVFAVSNKIHFLECTSGKLSKTLESHRSPISSFSLSNDNSHLASISATAAHVHNLSLGSYTALRGLSSTGTTAICVFSPHLRTRLFIGTCQLFHIYESTRPSAPMKTIFIGDSTSGEIIAISCSPYSKTLVAVACSGGTVGLVDLDKEKGLFKTINVQVPLTSIAFSPEGATIYLGTENGTLLVQDLRSLDKPPKSISVSETGDRIECLSIQQKLKIPSDPTSKSSTSTSTQPLTQQDINKKQAPVRKASSAATVAKSPTVKVAPPSPPPRATPVRKRAISGALGGFTSPPVRPRAISTITPSSGSHARKTISPDSVKTNVCSPSVGDQPSEGISVDVEQLLDTKKIIASTNKENRLKAPPKSHLASSSSKASKPSNVGTRVVTNTTRRTASATTESDTKPLRHATSVRSNSSGNNLHLKSRPSAITTSPDASGSKESTTEKTSPLSARVRSRPSSSASRHNTVQSTSPLPPVPAIPARANVRVRQRTQSTPSPARVNSIATPDLPSPSVDPITPFKGKKATIGEGLGFGTPEVNKRTELGNGKGKAKDTTSRQVEFVLESSEEKEEDELFNEQERSRIEEVLEEEDLEAEAEKTFKAIMEQRRKESEMQVSPLRSTSTSVKKASWAPIPSPRRSLTSAPLQPSSSTSSPSNPQTMLHAIMRDVMYDYQEDMRMEMMGMHLDMVKMGRDWKREVREMMDTYRTEIGELREENRVLREENERLRRGY